MKVILIVLDALGIQKNKNIGTLNNLIYHNPKEFNFFVNYQINVKGLRHFNYKKFNLYKTYIEPKNMVPDSYLGHSEMIGQHIKTKQIFLEEKHEIIINRLKHIGFKNISYYKGVIWVNNEFIIGNNGECQPGLNLNILWLKKPKLGESDLDRLGKNLLKFSNCTRVIQMWGNKIPKDYVVKNGLIKRNVSGDGINRTYLCIPQLKIYNDDYKVKHFGKEIEPNNLLEILIKNNVSEYLIGKVNKMFSLCSDLMNSCYAGTNTDTTFKTLLNYLNNKKDGFFFTNIQNIDLSGHEQNFQKATRVLKKINSNIPLIIKTLDEEDVLILTADHGNDSLSGDTFHTLEDVPLILISKNKFHFIREHGTSLGDIAASILNLYRLKSNKVDEGKILFYKGNESHEK